MDLYPVISERVVYRYGIAVVGDENRVAYVWRFLHENDTVNVSYIQCVSSVQIIDEHLGIGKMEVFDVVNLFVV